MSFTMVKMYFWAWKVFLTENEIFEKLKIF